MRHGRQYRDCQPPADELVAAGYYPVTREPRPEGNYRETRTLVDGMWRVGWEAFEPCDVPEVQYDLSAHFGQVDELVAILSTFGVSLPCERNTAKEEVRAAVAADPQRAGDAMKLMDILIALDREGITDGDILLIATRGEELK